ncbi:MAG: DNA-binding domain-containing protein [Rhodospirillum sp.]|nr:DNA-binding domain-containing protein [Rhodospirillum sp.]MCF8488691.1 DNA-binding domain-containing protein [Rhodospirillum sp.]MCF8501553.1 DNA-binding domain-containing protein [Rhodospirillum sp.]
MPNLGLATLQSDFGAGVLGRSTAVLAAIDGLGLDPAQRLSIHRNNTLIGLTEALGDTFSVVRRLVGEAFLGQVARDFLLAHPPTSGCLLDLGEEFPTFLGAYPPASTLPYLADVAVLEWAWWGALNDTDEPSLNPADLSTLAPDLFPLLRFSPIAASRLVVSPWPVATIWRVNQSEVADPPEVDLSSGPCHLLVLRPGTDVLFADLSAGEALFWRELATGAPLGEAAARVEATERDFDLGSVLARFFTLGAFAAVRIPA